MLLVTVMFLLVVVTFDPLGVKVIPPPAGLNVSDVVGEMDILPDVVSKRGVLTFVEAVTVGALAEAAFTLPPNPAPP